MIKPQLHTVRPAKKTQLQGEFVEQFNLCISEQYDGLSSIEINKPFKGVYFVDNILSNIECKRLCDTIDHNHALSFWSNGDKDKVEYKMFRNADTIEVNSRKLVDRIAARINTVFEELCLTVADNEEDPNYERELVGTWCATALNHDILFAKYPSFGSFAPHTDGRTVHDFNTRSFYSVIMFLNSIPAECGGGTRFYAPSAVNQLKQIEISNASMWTADLALSTGFVSAVAGRVLIFHQSMVHEGIPPAAPYEKYIIRSDVMFRRTPAICDTAIDREAYRLFREAEDLAECDKVDESIALFRRAFKMSPALAVIMGQS